MTYLVLVLIAIACSVHLLLKWATRKHDVFEKQGIKYVQPLPFIGTNGYLFKGAGLVEKVASTYNQFPNEKVVGLFEFMDPVYFIKSPEIIKKIFIKDFAYFLDHTYVIDSSVDEIFGNALSSMKGKQWRDMRSSLSPMFTGSKIRSMLQLMVETSKQLVDYINKEHEINGLTAYEIKDIFSRYTVDVIATCAFGVKCNSFKNKNNDLHQISQEVQNIQKPLQTLKFLCLRLLPKLSKFCGIKFIGEKSRSMFNELVIHAMEIRKRDGIVRPDMLQLFMKFKESQTPKAQDNDNEEDDNDSQVLNGCEKRAWTDSELIAQSFVFFLAGFDTSASVMMFAAYELAINPDIQLRLIAEIDATYKTLNGKLLSYDVLGKMKYLDAVVSETLRKWPPAVATDRKCVKTYTYEDDAGLKFTIEKGNIIWLPIYGIHRDPQYYPHPEKFDPERFSDENKAKIDTATFVPFGMGPRNCIGFRFALMEIKSLLFNLLLHFRLDVCKDTAIPLKLKKTLFGLVSEKEIKLVIKPRNDKIKEK